MRNRGGRMGIHAWMALALLGLSWPAAAAAQAPVDVSARTLQVDDLFGLRIVGAPVMHPDGTRFAFTVTTTSLEDERSSTRIWMGSVDGDTPRPMTRASQSASSPAFSPDGQWLSFLSTREGEDEEADGTPSTQVWALDLRGGEARRLTQVPQGVRSFEWSPDATRLALLIRDQDPEEVDSTRTWTSDRPRPWVIDRLQFKRDGAGYLDRLRTHLYVMDLATGIPTRLTDGDFDHSQPVWSPDGARIAFVSNRTEEPDANDNSDIWVVDADPPAGGVPTPSRITDNPGSDTSPAWSPDGRWIAHTSVIEPDLIWYATRHLAVSSVEGGAPRTLTQALDRNLSAPRFTPDGAGILALLEDSAERHLVRVAVDDGEVERLTDGGLSVRGWDAAGDRTVVLRSTPDRPAEIFVLEEGGARAVTAVNDDWLSGLRLGAVRNVTFEGGDGATIEGFITTPPDYEPGRRYPTLLRIHGGPVSQYDHAFNFEAQLFAASGYVVVMTNPRGSSGYGQDFSSVLWADWGNPDFEDVMAGVEYAIREGYADPDRLGVGGWSYGGILTNYVITKSDRFKAAITGASEVLYRANYGHDHYQRQWEAELGLPWENAEAWERISPFNDVGNVTTPTLIMGGEHDWNVPIQNSEQLYQALRRRGIETQLVVYPGQGHGIRVPSYQKDRYERYLAWYDQHVKGGRPVS